jgi:acyl-CoA dehydrogenase
MPAFAHDYPDDIQSIREGIAAFIKAEVIPRHEKHSKLLGDSKHKYGDDGKFTDAVWELVTEVRMAAARAGYYAMSAPEEIGGGGYGLLAYFAAWEQIFHLCGGRHWLGHFAISHWAKGPSPALRNVTAEARERVLPDMLSGKTTMCFALSEPGAGSDATMIKTRAVADKDGWLLTGDKIWTTNGPHADYAMVFAVTDPEKAGKRQGGISTFLVPTNSKGFLRESVIKMWGSAGGDESVLRFDEVRIEPWQLVGELHKGFDTALLGVNLGRIYNAARAVGLSRWAIELAVEYTKIRKTFGKPISEYQGVTFPLAEAAMEIHAAHLMSRNVAELLDQGHAAAKELSMAKAYAVEAGARAVDTAMQTHGAIGFTNEMHLTDAYVMLRKINVADGTREIMRRQIARRLLQGDLEM